METQKTRHIIEHQLAIVRDLLDKQRVVEHMVHSQAQPRHELVESLVRRQSLAELKNRLQRMHAADAAFILENLPPEDRSVVWQQLRDAQAGEVLLELSDSVRRALLSATSETLLIELLKHLDTDDVAYLAEDLPPAVLQNYLQSMSDQDRAFFTSAISYAEHTVGSLMGNLMVTVHETDSLAEVLSKLRGVEEFPGQLDKLFVIDRRGVLRGVLSIQSVLQHLPEEKVQEVMAKDVVRFSPDDDARDAAQAFERYGLVSAPVVNDRGKLLGRLTVDDMMDYLRERNSEELLALAGLRRDEDLFATIWQGARNRWLWVVINLCTAFIASRVIGWFEPTIVKLVALAALMPIVASVGGNTGNQTTALVIRTLALGQMTTGNFLLMIRRELGISLINGVLLGAVVAGFTLLLYANWELAGVMAAAMALNMLIAAAVGLFVPFTLDRLGRDPALGSSILLTATTDSMGFFIFLGLAAIFLMK
jgi:magnesium transporter